MLYPIRRKVTGGNLKVPIARSILTTFTFIITYGFLRIEDPNLGTLCLKYSKIKTN